MNIKKIFALAAVSTMASFAFADAANTLITFSTPGPDTYADGTPAKKGEIYALVWSENEAFAGFNADGTAINANDKIIFKAPLATGGENSHCGLTLFQIDSKVAPQGGHYEVYLLDTRAGNNLVTGAALAKTYGGTSGTANIAANGSVDNTKGGLVSNSDKIGGEGIADITPVITGFKVDGAKIKITVSNVFEGLPYVVQTGLEKNGELKADVTPVEGGLEFEVEPGDAKFFSIKLK